MSIRSHFQDTKSTKLSQTLALLPICVSAFVVNIQESHAHGAVGSPIARQYQCRLEGGYWNNTIPNADCRAAYQNGGNSAYPFTQWNELTANPRGQGNDLEKLLEAVPDGLLCAGGDNKKSGLDVPAVAWRKTPVTPVNGKIDVTWENTRSHTPSWMRIYLSKPNYNPQQPLRWADLEKIYDAPSPTPSPADRNGHLPGTITSFYKLSVSLPAGRTGDAVLFSYWQRQDAGNEGFFNCSDITILPGR